LLDLFDVDDDDENEEDGGEEEEGWGGGGDESNSSEDMFGLLAVRIYAMKRVQYMVGFGPWLANTAPT
jgi:hypothetical protein